MDGAARVGRCHHKGRCDMATVNFHNVRKAFGVHEVIMGVSLDIEDGEFVILVGPSGCGKSTLLRMLAGLETITGGEIKIGERIVNDVAPKDRDIAMVFQTYALYPHMTVAENMGFSLRLANAPREESAERVRRAADILALTPLLERLPRQLSGGQRQRVAMGRAIVRDPKVFLFDEPLSNLDAKLRVQMRAEIKALHHRLKTTMIYVTHDQVEAMTMADRIVVMNGGVVEQVGTPLELYDNPANLFVAGFIGSPSMNLIEGKIERHNNEAIFRTNRGLVLPLRHKASKYVEGKPAIYGLRPEHIELVAGRKSADLSPIVSVVEPTGSETQIVAEIEGHQIVAAIRGRVSHRPGDSIPLLINIAEVHLFDQGSGLSI
jgi:multiple sugar transport system ATP-binding protein